MRKNLYLFAYCMVIGCGSANQTTIQSKVMDGYYTASIREFSKLASKLAQDKSEYGLYYKKNNLELVAMMFDKEKQDLLPEAKKILQAYTIENSCGWRGTFRKNTKSLNNLIKEGFGGGIFKSYWTRNSQIDYSRSKTQNIEKHEKNPEVNVAQLREYYLNKDLYEKVNTLVKELKLMETKGKLNSKLLECQKIKKSLGKHIKIDVMKAVHTIELLSEQFKPDNDNSQIYNTLKKVLEPFFDNNDNDNKPLVNFLNASLTKKHFARFYDGGFDIYFGNKCCTITTIGLPGAYLHTLDDYDKDNIRINADIKVLKYNKS